jgi:hypothetical protein
MGRRLHAQTKVVPTRPLGRDRELSRVLLGFLMIFNRFFLCGLQSAPNSKFHAFIIPLQSVDAYDVSIDGTSHQQQDKSPGKEPLCELKKPP